MSSMLLVGDVHGCLLTLQALLRQCPGVPVCLVGDLIDRGPSSAQVVRFVRDNGYDAVRGNHELMMMDLTGRRLWLNPRNGGDATLRSYDHLSTEQFADDMAWMDTLPYIKEYPDCKNSDGRSLIVTHSGIFHTNYENDLENLCWNRMQPFDLKTKFNVFGHTPVEEPVIKEHFALIDTGACYGASNWDEPIAGVGMTALQFPEMNLFFQKTID
jgi:serine/threonine protein phosphatase 1